jgi:hypothetical protein
MANGLNGSYRNGDRTLWFRVLFGAVGFMLAGWIPWVSWSAWSHGERIQEIFTRQNENIKIIEANRQGITELTGSYGELLGRTNSVVDGMVNVRNDISAMRGDLSRSFDGVQERMDKLRDLIDRKNVER